MPYIEPNSTVILIGGVPFDASYENTMFFETPEKQYEYFVEDNNGLRRTTLTKYSYARKTRGSIKVEKPIADLYGVNYMMFRNISFENKWFFAFVTQVEYINNITTEVFYEMDLIQTWLFDIDFNQCWIERQHTATDNIGDTLTDEGLETGDYIVNEEYYLDEEPAIIIASTLEYDDTVTPPKFDPVAGEFIDGRENNGDYYSGTTFDVETVAANVNTILEKFTEKNKINAIISVFMGAKKVFQDTALEDYHTTVQTYNSQHQTGYYIDSHPVRNKKLLQWPFNFLQISNLQGDSVDLCYEYFSNPEYITLKRWGNKSTNPAILLWPQNYKGMNDNFEEVVTVQSFPLCCFNNDTYKAWLAQNKGMLTAGAFGIVSSLGLGVSNIVGGGKIANAAGSYFDSGNMSLETYFRESHGGQAQQRQGLAQIGGGLAGAATMLGKLYDHSTLPPTQHGSGNGDLMFQAGLNMFGVYHKSITKYYAEKIDTYFDMYGYKVNKCGIPQLNVRPCWTYIKTAGCSLKSKDPLTGYREIPADDSRAIERLFDKGIRFWKSTATFGVFGYPNDNRIQVSNNAVQGGE